MDFGYLLQRCTVKINKQNLIKNRFDKFVRRLNRCITGNYIFPKNLKVPIEHFDIIFVFHIEK